LQAGCMQLLLLLWLSKALDNIRVGWFVLDTHVLLEGVGLWRDLRHSFLWQL
jgi:hypothetical protein